MMQDYLSLNWRKKLVKELKWSQREKNNTKYTTRDYDKYRAAGAEMNREKEPQKYQLICSFFRSLRDNQLFMFHFVSILCPTEMDFRVMHNISFVQ